MALRKNRGSTGPYDRARAAKGMRAVCAALWREAALQTAGLPWERVEIQLIARIAGRRRLDADGLASGMGPAIDAAVDAGIIPDDRPWVNVLSYTILFRRAPSEAEVGVLVLLQRMEAL